MRSVDLRSGPANGNWAEFVVSANRALRCFEDLVASIVDAEGCPNVSADNVALLLSVGDGPRRFRDIVIADRVRGTTVSYALRSLEREGLVSTLKDPADGRQKIVVPTDRGRRVLSSVRSALAGRRGDVVEAIRSTTLFETHCSTYANPERRTA